MSGIVFKGPGFSAPINFVKMYSDGTPMVKTDEWDKIVEHADTIVVRPENLNEFMVAMFLVDAVDRAGGWINRLVLPYIPGARQDRSNPTGDVLFTARSIAQIINRTAIGKVVVLDPHSEVSSNLILASVEYPLGLVAARMWQGYGGIIAPDKGAKQRAEAFAAVMGKEVTYASKNRDVSTGKLSGFSVDVVPGRHYLVVDDICDGGGTFVGLGEKIAEQGAFADLYVTHGIFSKGTEMLKQYYKNIYTTDSRRMNDRNDVMVIPIVQEMIDYVE